LGRPTRERLQVSPRKRTQGALIRKISNIILDQPQCGISVVSIQSKMWQRLEPLYLCCSVATYVDAEPCKIHLTCKCNFIYHPLSLKEDLSFLHSLTTGVTMHACGTLILLNRIQRLVRLTQLRIGFAI
jgi:hypothetical protein